MPFSLGSLTNIINPRGSALQSKLGSVFSGVAGVLGAGRPDKTKKTVVGFNTPGGVSDSDWRVRISLAENSDYFYNSYNSGLMAPLFQGSSGNNGVIFPYTPAIQIQHNARYANQKLTHSNYDGYFYEGSEVQAITVNGEFTAHSSQEARYVLAVVYFLRACTKMWFGQGERAGNPPPMVFLDGYGSYYFPHVPCVITGFNHSLPADVDYIEAPGEEGPTRIPTQSTISVTLQPIYSRKRSTEFDLDDFAAGKLVDRGFI